MAVSIVGTKFRAWNSADGKPLAFGKVYTYKSGTNIPKPSFTSEGQEVSNTNPVILNAAGYADIYLDGSYKIVVKDANDVEIHTTDPVTPGKAEEWQNSTPATYLTPSSFKCDGNLTNIFDKDRRVRLDSNATEYTYSTVESSIFSSGETTVTVVGDIVPTGLLSVSASIVGKESLSVSSMIKRVAAISDLFGLVGEYKWQQIIVSCYHNITDFSGGGRLIWNPNRLKSSHDGFRYFDPEKAFPADFSDDTQKYAWFSGGGAGNGVWERVFDDSLSINQGGALPNVTYSTSIEIQNCLNKRVPLTASAGTFIIGTKLIYDTTGQGEVTGLRLKGAGKYDTIFDNQTGEEMLQLEAGTGIDDFQRGLDIRGFTIDDTTSSTTSIGLFSTSNFRGFIGNILIKNQGLDGLYFSSTVGDATDNYQITIRRVESQNNGRHGMLISGDPNAINGGFDVQHNLFINNGGLGIAAYSCTSSTFARNGFAYNLGGGIVVSHAGGPFSKNNEIYNNEFDSNAGVQILIDYALNTDIGLNYFVVNSGAPTVTELVKITANSRNTTVRKSQPRMPAGYSGVTAFTVEPGTFGNVILDTDWSSWELAGNTKFNNLASDTIIRDGNEYLYLPAQGVKFPEIQVPSSNRNTLDDYKEATWTPLLSNLTNISGGLVTFSEATKVGNKAHLEFGVDCTVDSTGVVSFDFDLPWTTKNAPSKSVGVALESAATLSQGVVYDISAGSNNLARVRFSSITAGAGREIRVSLNYITE